MVNYAHQRRCIVCAASKPDRDATQPSAPVNAWDCPSCGMRNFAHQSFCVICQTAQPVGVPLGTPKLPEPPRVLPPPQPEVEDILLPDLDALLTAETPIDRRTITLTLLNHILGGDTERAARLLDGQDTLSVHDFLRRAPRYGELIAASKTWVKSADRPPYLLTPDKEPDAGIKALEGTVAKSELYREWWDDRTTYVLYLDYECMSPETRKRLDGVALIPVHAETTREQMPAPGTRVLVGWHNDRVHDLL
jgi:hypothetical protein